MRRTWTSALAWAAVVAVGGCSTTQTGHGFGQVFTTVSGLAAQATKAGNDITNPARYA
jgi:hypothetical protein